MSDCEKLYKNILNTKYDFNDRYGISFINQKEAKRVNNYLSDLRKYKCFNTDDFSLISSIFKYYIGNYYRVKEMESKEPRKLAQIFIGKKKVRQFIFKRDKFKCLSCGCVNDLTIDHINPINKGGKNELSNLQTLCRSCNSKKSDNFKDYRNG